jgi:hypothetical protein
MKKLFVFLSGVVFMLLQSSCVGSLHSLATYKTIITDKRLNGTWSDGKDVFTIQPLIEGELAREKDGSKTKLGLGDSPQEITFYSNAYLITIKQKGIEYLMLGALSKVNDRLFVDVMSFTVKDPKKPEDKGSGFEFSVDYLPTSSIAQIQFLDKNRLSIKYLNGDFIKEQVTKGNLRLKHEQDNLFGSFVITASSFELKQFLEKYGHDERLYYSKDSTILTRKG